MFVLEKNSHGEFLYSLPTPFPSGDSMSTPSLLVDPQVIQLLHQFPGAVSKELQLDSPPTVSVVRDTGILHNFPHPGGGVYNFLGCHLHCTGQRKIHKRQKNTNCVLTVCPLLHQSLSNQSLTITKHLLLHTSAPLGPASVYTSTKSSLYRMPTVLSYSNGLDLVNCCFLFKSPTRQLLLSAAQLALTSLAVD